MALAHLAASMVPVYRMLLSALLGLVLLAGQARAVCNATQLCEPTDDPCVISASCTINPASTFDIRPRALVIQKTLEVTTGTAPVVIRAGSITMEPGAKILFAGTSGTFGIGGDLELFSDSTIDLLSQGNSRSKIAVDGPFVGGSVAMEAVGNIYLKTTVNVGAGNKDGLGGTFDCISQTGSITIEDNGAGAGVNATGGTDEGSGGSISLTADQNVVIDALLDASNGDSFAEITIEAINGDVTTTTRGTMKVNASTVGDGGSVDILAGGNVGLAGNLEGKAAGTGAGDSDEGGIGGDFTLSANNVTFTAFTIDFRGAGPDGDGGGIDVEALGNVVVDSPLLASVGGIGFGGDVALVADGDIDVKKKVDVNGGEVGGTLEIFSLGQVTVRNQLLADAGFDGGDISIEGCNIDILSGASLSSSAPPQQFLQGGTNTLISHGQLTMAGSLSAVGKNYLLYRDLVPVVTGTVNPAATLLQDTNLSCCVDCGETTTTTVPTTTTTSSTVVVTTSTLPPTTSTLPPPTSTTSTQPPTTSTLPPTTSTLPPPTSTTSTLPPTTSTLPPTTSTLPPTTSTLPPTTSTLPPTTSTLPPTTSTLPPTTSTLPPTTSTVTSTSTSTSTVSSTTSTTTDVTAPTSTTFTTSTVAPTTTSTTTSTLPLECYEQSLGGFDAVTCRLGTIGEQLNAEPEEDLGGRRAKRQLTRQIEKADKQISKAQEFLEAGKPERKVAGRLRKAGRQLRVFDKKVRRGLSRNKIRTEVADFWLSLAEGASAQINLLRANVSSK